MLFNSPEFLVFFAVVFTAYWLLPGTMARNLLLLAASYFFYVCFNGYLAMVVAASSVADFFIGIALEESAVEARRKKLLTLSIVMNLGLLFYFKYANFFLGSVHDFLARFGIHQKMPVIEVLLPIGISFYTFEAISYTVDVYKGRARAENNLLHFLLFITFFPRMVAGPIIRARNFLPQLEREKHFNWSRIELGMQYILLGFFKKIAIADRMAALVDPVYDSPGKYCTSAVWYAVIAYSFQVYCDFSGYSDIAIGTAHMLGFKLPENFNMPYLARNITDFWRRWHISLSTWLRDYVFISLGGSRGSALRTAFTLLITFALCGLWHGAKWTFVVFGLIQGAMMLINRYFQKACRTAPAAEKFLLGKTGTSLCVAFTYITFITSLVVFRSQDFSTAGTIFRAMFLGQEGPTVREPVGPASLAMAALLLGVAHAAGQSGYWKKLNARLSPAQIGLAYASLAASIFAFMIGKQTAFIYFQF